MNKKSNMADGCPFEESINYLILASWWLIATRCGFISTFLKHLNFDWPYHLGRCFTGFARRPESREVVFVKFPWPGKSWKMSFCPRKSWNLLGNDVDADSKVVFFCYFFTACDSDEHILQYGCCYRTVYVVSNCCLSLYVNIAGLRQGPEKMILGSWNVLGPDLRNILGQSYDNAKVTIDLR